MHEHPERGRVDHGERPGLLQRGGVSARTPPAGHERRDLLWLLALVAVLLGFFLWPTFAYRWPFGVGPDEPVYLWWARVGAAEGISLVGARPGTPALIPTVAGALHMELVPALAGLQYALGAAIGTATIALVRGRSHGGRPGWLLAGLFAGMFGVHLAGGYLANLAYTLPFIAAAAALARRSRRGMIGAALLLGGGGLSHPQFFLVGAFILIVSAAMAWILEPEHGWRSDAGRVLAALGGGGVVVAAGLLSMVIGPPQLSVDTSKDGFLRRAGLADALHETYQFRFRENVRRYAPWVTLPLAAVGTLQVRGFTRRFLVAWLACTIIGVPLGIATGWFPPERLMTFGFALPMLAALGVTWVWERTEPRRWLTVVATGDPGGAVRRAHDRRPARSADLHVPRGPELGRRSGTDRRDPAARHAVGVRGRRPGYVRDVPGDPRGEHRAGHRPAGPRARTCTCSWGGCPTTSWDGPP